MSSDLEDDDSVGATGASRRKASKTAQRRSALVDSDDDDDDDENLFDDDDSDDDDDDDLDEKRNKAALDEDLATSGSTKRLWEKYTEALETLKEFMVEQPSNEGAAATSEGLQPFELEENAMLLQAEQEEYTQNLMDIDAAISKVADARKWSFHKDMLLTFLSDKDSSLSLEGMLLVGIVARQILKRSKAEEPPNKTLGQELFVKLKGDANKSNSIALYVSAKWPQEMFKHVQMNFPSQPDNNLRIHIIKAGLGFVENSFVIDTAKKVDLLKSRNLPWADFSMQVHKWAFENSHKGTARLMESANRTKTHLEKLGAEFPATTEASEVASSVEDHKKNNNTHVLKDEEDLKRIQERKNAERRAAMRMQMRRGSSLSTSSPATTAATISAPAGTPSLPNITPAAPPAPRPTMATAAPPAPTGISYSTSNTFQQTQSSSAPASTGTSYSASNRFQQTQSSSAPASTGTSYSASNSFQQSQSASAPTASYASESAVGAGSATSGYNYSAGSTGSRWNSRRANDLPTQEDPGSAIARPGWEERLANRPAVHEARPGWEERVALRPPLHGDTESGQYSNADGYTPQYFNDPSPPASSSAPSQYQDYQRGSTSGYQDNGYGAGNQMGGSGYDAADPGRPPVAPTAYNNDRSQQFQGGRGRGGGRGGDYQGRNKRQRSESPSFGGGSAGRGRGIDLTKPAWMTRQQDEGPGGAPPPPAQDEPPMGGGRGRHTTQPAWMTRQQDQGLGSAPPPADVEPLNGRGRGRGKTLPAWMTQQQ